MNSLDHDCTVSMLYKALLADPDTNIADTICHDIFLATLGAADILLALIHSFTNPTSTFKIFCKQWCGDELTIFHRLLFHLFWCPLDVIIDCFILLKFHFSLWVHLQVGSWSYNECRVFIFFQVFVVYPKKIYRHRKFWLLWWPTGIQRLC